MRVSLPLCLLFLGSMILFSCEKPVLDENGTLPTDNLGLEYTDTLTVSTFTVLEDTLRSDELAINVLGSMADPVFGKTHASLYTEFTLPVNNLTFGDAPALDSIVLALHLSGSYGNITTPQTFIVYRMHEEMNIDSAYFSDRTFALEPEVGRITIAPNVTDSVTVDSVKRGPQLRIKLNNSLGQDLLNQAGGSHLVNNAAFQAYFNGLYILPDTNSPGSGMVYIDLASSDTRLSLYYNDTVTNFFVTSASESVNHFVHNYSGSVVAGYLDSTSAAGDTLSFAQSLSGVKTKVFVPYIKNLGNIAINKAEMVFTAVGDTIPFANPGKLIANGVGPNGSNALLLDQLVTAGYLGGGKLTEGGQVKYKLNLARYYQGLIEGDADAGVYIFPTPPSRIADRVVLAGGNHSQYKVKLNLTYTKLD
jgi:hypothetical protein